MLENTPESPLCCKEIQPVHSEGDQPWDFFGRNDAQAETPILWPPDVKSWLIGKDPDAWKNWGWEEKGTTEDEMAGWHHRLNGHEFGYTPGVGDGQGGLACCDSWGRKESDTTEQLNWTEIILKGYRRKFRRWESVLKEWDTNNMHFRGKWANGSIRCRISMGWETKLRWNQILLEMRQKAKTRISDGSLRWLFEVTEEDKRSECGLCELSRPLITGSE